MFLPDYKEFYDRLLTQYERYIQNNGVLKGDFMKLMEGEINEDYLNDYRLFAFTKSTKILRSIIVLLEMGNYEDVLILSRTVMECYLSQRYLGENYNYSTLADMVRVPIGTNVGALTYSNGTLKSKDGNTELEYNIVKPEDMSIGKDKTYYYNLYAYLCELAHCNISQLYGYSNCERKMTLDSDFNAEPANLLPLFIFCKLFENVVLLESTHFETAEEDNEAVRLLVELTEFLYEHLHDLYDSLEKNKLSPNYALRKIAHHTMNSFKEQTGKVDKTFVAELEKQYKETPFETFAKGSLLNSSHPSECFEEMLKMKGFEKKYPELYALVGLEQNPVYHPEGDVWTHTMQVIDRAAGLRDKVSDPYSFMLLALTHDLGKAVTTKRDEKGVIHSIGHETQGIPIVKKFLKRITNREKVRKYVIEMIPHHMKPSRYAQDHSRQKATDEMFASVTYPQDLIYFAKSDRNLSEESEAFLWERYAAFSGSADKPDGGQVL